MPSIDDMLRAGLLAAEQAKDQTLIGSIADASTTAANLSRIDIDEALRAVLLHKVVLVAAAHEEAHQGYAVATALAELIDLLSVIAGEIDGRFHYHNRPDDEPPMIAVHGVCDHCPKEGTRWMHASQSDWTFVEAAEVSVRVRRHDGRTRTWRVAEFMAEHVPQCPVVPLPRD